MKRKDETVSLSASSRPQYNYFYGSTTDASSATTIHDQQEQDSLIGEELVTTDHEGDNDTPHSEQDLQHLIITNGNSKPPWFLGSSSGNKNTQQPPVPSGLGRTLTVILLVVTLFSALILLLPHSLQTIPQNRIVTIPFPKVSREDHGDAVETFVAMDLFHPTLLSGGTENRSFVFPFPTGAFWTNLIVSSPHEEASLSYPIVVYPYAYKWSKNTLQMSYPSARRFIDDTSIIDTFAPELTMSTEEDIENRYVTKFDPLSVTLRYVSSVESKWETALVQGSPYTTIKYLNATPVFKTLSLFKSVRCPGDDEENFSDLNDYDDDDDDDHVHANEHNEKPGHRRLFGVCSIDDSGSTHSTLRGVQFILNTQEGVSWLLFSSEPMNLIFDKDRRTSIKSIAPFTGIVRLAYIPAKEARTMSSSSTGLRRLIYHAGVYPTGGQVTWEFPPQPNARTRSTQATSNRAATVHFNFATSAMADNSLRPNAVTNGLLMLALPHQADVLPRSSVLHKKHFDLKYSCIKGPLTPVMGSTWSYEEPLFDLEFDGPSIDVSPAVRGVILGQATEDIDRVLPTLTEDIYGFGKQVARLAQLVHIVDQLSIGDDLPMNKLASEVSTTAKNLLFGFLEAFLTGETSDGVVYDANLGGLVSKKGLDDTSEDFGNGRYNDHHFHYGYILYASAIAAKQNASFVENFGSHVDALFHDIAHPGNPDSRPTAATSPFFPLSRHKSWFDGHSFATGMFPFGTGKSQESSSEAVNAYYGAYLWSLVRHGQTRSPGGSDLTDFAQLLFSMEIRGAQRYWHMIPPSVLPKNVTDKSVYPSRFEENFMVGNVGMLDVASRTWFGNDPLYVQMINAIPITAATGLLFEEDYVEHEYPFLTGSRSGVEMAWRGYTTAIHAIVDANEAWEDASSIVSYELDAAISKSQVLYWISQRPGFSLDVNATVPRHETKAEEESTSGGSTTTTNSSDKSSQCESHSACTLLGLTGQCCPTSEGASLSCCDNDEDTRR